MSNAIEKVAGLPVKSMDDLMTLGSVLAKSGYFDDARQEAQAVAKVLAGIELGIGPFQAMTGLHIVKGKMTVGANVIAARIRAHPRYDYHIVTLNDRECVIQVQIDGKESVAPVTFTMEDAKRAKVSMGPGSAWDKFPKNMLFARCISNVHRFYCPDIFGAAPVYTPDEMGAKVEVDESGEETVIIDVTPEPEREETPQKRSSEWQRLNRKLHAEYGHDMLHDHALYLKHSSFSEMNEDEMTQLERHLKSPGNCTICAANQPPSDDDPFNNAESHREPQEPSNGDLDGKTYEELADLVSENAGHFEITWDAIREGGYKDVTLDQLVNLESKQDQARAKLQLIELLKRGQ